MQINNIFTALVREKSSGAIQEFVLWVVTCVMIVLSMVAAIIGDGGITWIMVMVFAIGLAVILAFRLKAIAMLYGVCAFHFLAMLIHFLAYKVTAMSVINLILFILLMLLGIALVVCQFIQAFSKIDMGNILTILVIVDTVGIALLQILMFALPYLGDVDLEWWHHHLNSNGYWFGTIALWCMLIVITLLYIFTFWGRMNSNRGKILSQSVTSPGIRGVEGSFRGRSFYFRGGLFVIGSGNGVSLPIPDRYVSSKHCSIRFNNGTGYYEIMDESTNGTFLVNGTYLQRGVYQSVARGTIICIGSLGQQFRLL